MHVDHLLRPIRMTDGARATVWQATWTPFGTAHAVTGTATQSLRFPGQYFLIEHGLAYNWHRFYDATTGRYTQPDPLGMPDGPGRYVYAGNSPLMNVDPLGFETAIIIMYDYGIIGSHAALFIAGANEDFLYDPAGSYNRCKCMGSGRFATGSDADLDDYIDYHRSLGTKIVVFRFATDVDEEATIRRNAEDIGDPGVPWCSLGGVGPAIAGVGPFKNVKSRFNPANLASQLYGLPGLISIHSYDPK